MIEVITTKDSTKAVTYDWDIEAIYDSDDNEITDMVFEDMRDDFFKSVSLNKSYLDIP